ncbi:hypothetical protein CNMCM8686_007323 [Aspergillus fumigatus]|nr:hypothetical protein CNMCM8686_007323 [Aspergillus fumigatus]
MKVLCLHGKGTSGAIFKSQTASFRSHLNDLDIDFDFIDGCYPSTAAAGIDLFYPAPYYSFWEDDSPEAITKTWLRPRHRDAPPPPSAGPHAASAVQSGDLHLRRAATEAT